MAAASAAAIKEKVSKSNLVLYTNLCTRGGCGCRRCRCFCWLAVLSASATAAVAEAEVVVVVAVVLLFLLLPQLLLLWWLFEVSFIFFVAFVSQFLFPLVVAVAQL